MRLAARRCRSATLSLSLCSATLSLSLRWPHTVRGEVDAVGGEEVPQRRHALRLVRPLAPPRLPQDDYNDCCYFLALLLIITIIITFELRPTLCASCVHSPPPACPITIIMIVVTF